MIAKDRKVEFLGVLMVLLFLVIGFITVNPLQAIIAPGTLGEYQRNKNMYQPQQVVTTPQPTINPNSPVTQKEFQEYKASVDKFIQGQRVVNDTTNAVLKKQIETNESIAEAIEALQRTDEAIYKVMITLVN